jgi:hypothetical protein
MGGGGYIPNLNLIRKNQNLKNTLVTLNPKPCHQKVQNKYQYLPWCSWHPLHKKKAFVTGELRLYVLRESTLTGFLHIRRLFYDHLRARGYPTSFIRTCFREITYDMKTALLASTAKVKVKDLKSFTLKSFPLGWGFF